MTISSATIVALCKANLGKHACSTNSAGGGSFGTSCTGNGGIPELWCSDFAKWAWKQAGVPNTGGLNASAGTFASYGSGLHSTPHVGDAVLFGYNGQGYADHVAIVTQVNANGTIISIGGDENGSGHGDAWAASSSVAQDGPYHGAVGSTDGPASTVSGYVTGIGVVQPAVSRVHLDEETA